MKTNLRYIKIYQHARCRRMYVHVKYPRRITRRYIAIFNMSNKSLITLIRFHLFNCSRENINLKKYPRSTNNSHLFGFLKFLSATLCYSMRLYAYITRYKKVKFTKEFKRISFNLTATVNHQQKIRTAESYKFRRNVKKR